MIKKTAGSSFFQRTTPSRNKDATSLSRNLSSNDSDTAPIERECRDNRWSRMMKRTKGGNVNARDDSIEESNSNDDAQWVMPKDSFEVNSGRFNHVRKKPTDKNAKILIKSSSPNLVVATRGRSASRGIRTGRDRAATPIVCANRKTNNNRKIDSSIKDDMNHVHFLDTIEETKSQGSEPRAAVESDKRPDQNNGSNKKIRSDFFQCDSCKMM